MGLNAFSKTENYFVMPSLVALVLCEKLLEGEEGPVLVYVRVIELRHQGRLVLFDRLLLVLEVGIGFLFSGNCLERVFLS